MTQIDDVDEGILRALRANSRLSLRKLANVVYMSAPAVAERVRRLEAQGIIKGYTIVVDESKCSQKIVAYVQVFIQAVQQQSLLSFVQKRDEVVEFYRISGDAGYLLKVQTADHESLNTFLDMVLCYGTYHLNLVLSSYLKTGA